MKIYNATKNTLLASQTLVADSYYSRLMGLMGKRSFPKGTALWLKDCPSVHTFFMNFPIDVVFLDKNMVVTNVVENLKPWRATKPFQFKNNSCLEFYTNEISSKVKKGDIIDVRS